MNMKTLNRIFLMLALTASVGFSQVATVSTTLSTAVVAGPVSQFCLASGASVVLPSATQQSSYLVVDAEAVQILSAGYTANCFKVKRGQLGSGASGTHNAGALVWISQAATGTGDSSRPFSNGAFISQRPMGPCVASAQYTLPLVIVGSILGGDVITCSGQAGAQIWTSLNPLRFVNVGTVIASATTIAPVSYVTHVSGTAAIVNITVPAGFVPGGTFVVIPDGAFTTTNAGNIAIASTAVVSRAITFTYDATANKWFPSY
jgi:hypothetical protein